MASAGLTLTINGVDKTGAALGSASRNFGNFKSEVGQNMYALNVATDVMRGNFEGAAMGAGRLIGKLGGIGMTAPQIALATGAVVLLVAGMKKLISHTIDAGKKMVEMASEKVKTRLDEISDAYKRLRFELSLTNAELKNEIDYSKEILSAKKDVATSFLTLAKTRALSVETDEAKRKKIEAEYNLKITESEYGFSQQEDTQALDALRKKLTMVREEARLADEQVKKLRFESPWINEEAKLLDKYSEETGRVWLMGGGLSKAAAEKAKELRATASKALSDAMSEVDRSAMLQVEARRIEDQIKIQQLQNIANANTREAKNIEAQTSLDDLGNSAKETSKALQHVADSASATYASVTSQDFYQALYGRGSDNPTILQDARTTRVDAALDKFFAPIDKYTTSEETTQNKLNTEKLEALLQETRRTNQLLLENNNSSRQTAAALSSVEVM